MLNKITLAFVRQSVRYTTVTLKKEFSSSVSKYAKQIKPMFFNAPNFQNKTALCDLDGNYSYGNLYLEAKELSMKISRQLGGVTGERVLFLCSNDASYVITIWAIWMSGQIAVPLSPLHPEHLLKYYINDTNSSLLVSSTQFQEKMSQLSKKTETKLYVLDEKLKENSKSKNGIREGVTENILPMEFYQNTDAMILYTSGTTGNPKGVVITHKNISTQIQMLLKAWKWTPNDVILHTLPLHHIHGTVNCLFCPLSMGATTVMLPKFNAKEVWSKLLNKTEEKITVFMAVPTIYSKLIEEHEKFSEKEKIQVKTTLSNNVRLMVSGSAPLPTPLYEKWKEISGHRLLERYGMTEIGMCLSNLYDSNREPGYVGLPLPGVSVAIADSDSKDILLECTNDSGEITFRRYRNIEGDISGDLLVKGDSVFKEYYNKPKETAKEFTKENWFITGDLCQYINDKSKFKILGRSSVDIIKSGGYKISALNIETALLAHPSIQEIAVMGVPDEVYGEKVAAIAVCNRKNLSLDEIKGWALERIPKYWIPTVLKLVDEIPKNAMGKVNKKELKKTIFKHYNTTFSYSL